MTNKLVASVMMLGAISTAYAVNFETPASSEINKVTPKAADPYQYCFNSSIWIVPPQTLLAYLYNNGTTTQVSDQTVWVTSNYNKGYFSGKSYTAISTGTLSEKYMIGSVTADGKVFITFYSGTSLSTDLISGIGTLAVNSAGQCTFTMQMNSGQNGVDGLIHWSYMIPVKPGDPFYNNLPGTNMSVPQFLAQF
jgi:hypothetical protein